MLYIDYYKINPYKLKGNSIKSICMLFVFV